ncbi:G5 domain-containing protein [Sanguibacter sp. Leaf3]|uniref:aggregation-promoting factor C-terminal-like domain-containing protein n=1 Tax=Sanguibacter sp. Leaf3 TaxID=1736209 RepID=UPI0007018BC7|nr:ubiquitin-like domain-containing protein [Sanguibacter sp. Leaf3]KQT99889.1 hypothetical protein ASG53_03430 [Sanguibacter sp. Leaf3]
MTSTHQSTSSTARRSRRPARLLAQALILATVVGGTTAFTTLHKTVTVEVDGVAHEVAGFSRTVDDVLASDSLDVDPQDQVFPSPESTVNDGDLIVVRTVRDVQVEIDGTVQTIQSSARTVGEVLDELGDRAAGADVSASRSAEVGREPLVITTPKTVTLAVDGQQLPISSTEGTVRELLLTAGVVLDSDDTVTLDPPPVSVAAAASTAEATAAALDAATVDGMVVTIGRAATDTSSTQEVLPYATQEVEDATLPVGKTKVTQKGVLGQALTTYAVTVVDGVETGREVVARRVTVEPQDEIVAVGTLELPDPSLVVVDPDSARAIAQTMVAERGWGSEQFACLDSLWQKESGWKVTSDNPSSSAYGIPQALPGSKMSSAGADWQTNAATQITWGLGYISDRYGTPCAAWSHSKAKNFY